MLKLIFSAWCLLWTTLSIAQKEIPGLNWKFKDPASNTWYPAKVPGNVFLDLVSAKKIPHPFHGINEDSVQWVSTIDWEYQSFPFDIDEETLSASNLLVQFPGIDGEADIYLNDEFLLHVDNYYRTWEVNIKGKLKSKGNIFDVKFSSPEKTTNQRADDYGFTPPGDKRVFLRKPPFHFGWDWGPKLAGVGLLKQPKIIAFEDAFFESIRFETKSISNSQAEVEAIVKIKSKKKERAEIQISSGQEVWTIQELSLKPGQDEYRINFKLSFPKIWWTHDLGQPYLYSVDIQLFVGSETKASKKKVKVGLRTIELISEVDDLGRAFTFRLNGKDIFSKGANYIPQSPFQAEVSSGDYKNLIDDVRNSGMNMLRVWGGGIYEENEFYDRCDQSGILVWQDFMFACAMYPGNREFIENVKKEAEEQVSRLSGHACLALWCGNNEISEGWARWGWKDGLSTDQLAKLEQAYRQIFKTVLPQVVSENTSIDYWESSPLLGRGDPLHQSNGDAHYWGVWHDAEPFENYTTKVPRFMSEFGFQSMPALNTWKKYIPESELNLNSASVLQHQKHPRGTALITEYMGRWYDLPTDFDDYIFLSQATQAHGIQLGIEAHRRARPYCMGTLYWQLNDCWPAASWSSIDVEGRWKPLQYAVKRSYSNVKISTVEVGDSISIYAINDSLHVLEGKLKLSLINFGGDVLWTEELDTEINAESVTHLASISKRITEKQDSTKTCLAVEFEDAVYGKFKDHRFFTAPKELVLVPVEPAVFAERTEYGYELTLISETLIKDCWIEWNGAGKLSDNFFDILPFEPKIIKVIQTENSREADFEVKCWNTLQAKLKK